MPHEKSQVETYQNTKSSDIMKKEKDPIISLIKIIKMLVKKKDDISSSPPSTYPINVSAS